MNYEGAYRTAPATPGLLNIQLHTEVNVIACNCTNGYVLIFVLIMFTPENLSWMFKLAIISDIYLNKIYLLCQELSKPLSKVLDCGLSSLYSV